MARIQISDLREGDRVDLEGDPVADRDGNNPEFEFEFEVVMEIAQETQDCILVHFESGFSCGFPLDHSFEVDEPRPDPAAATP